jgi:tripartite-type tricarboxylate transporter receptor subunit TctC
MMAVARKKGDAMKKPIGFAAGILLPVLVLAVAGAPGLARAQAWPSKPIHIIIAQAPGSASDFISRVVGNGLSAGLGQPVVIDAKPGAGGALGTEIAARSTPDGYTLFMGNNSTHGANPAVYAKLPYDAVKDFAPISFVGSVPYVLVVDPKLPAKTLQEFIALVKSRPGKMNYASAGNGSTHHFCGELLKSMTGIDMLHIPYKGSGPGIAALLAGDVSMMFSNVADIGSQVKAGKVRALAVTATERAPTLPDVPTMAQAGLSDFVITSWFGLMAPAGTPAPIIARLNAETAKVLNRADVKAKLAAQGLEVAPGTPEQLGAHIKSEIAKFTRIARSAGIHAE